MNKRWHADHLNAKAEVRLISAEDDGVLAK